MPPRRGRGEGSIEELPSGKFRAILSVGRKADGTRDKRQETFDTKRQALAWLRERQAEQSRGRLTDAGSRTVGQLLDEWLAVKKTKVEPHTWRWYDRHARLHIRPTIGGRPLGALRPADVSTMHVELTRRDVT